MPNPSTSSMICIQQWEQNWGSELRMVGQYTAQIPAGFAETSQSVQNCSLGRGLSASGVALVVCVPITDPETKRLCVVR